MNSPCHILFTLVLASLTSPIAFAVESQFLVLPEGPTNVSISRSGEPYLDLEFVGWGPQWAWMGWDGELKESGNAAQLINRAKAADAVLSLTATVRQTHPRRLQIQIDLSTTKDTPLTYIVASLALADRAFAKSTVQAVQADGTKQDRQLPLDKSGLGTQVTQFTVRDAAQATLRVAFAPACQVASDGAIRVVLAGELLRANAPVRQEITVELPEDFQFFTSADRVPADAGSDNWFEFRPDLEHAASSEIGMQDWLDRPAGKHGRITRQADALQYDGKPIRLWGLNVCYGACAPDRELAERRADCYAKYGVNAVRLHKFADGPGWAGIQAETSSVKMDPEGQDRMDYFVSQLKERGIYVKLSAHFGALKLGPDDKQFVPYLEEFGKLSGRADRVTTPHSAVHYSPELQDVQIRQMLAILTHKNPYTGLRYADDPAVAFVEIINEQSIMFYSSMEPLKASPTLRKQVAHRFTQWLRAKYGTHAKLLKAWGGERALDSFTGDGFPAVGEHLDRDNLLPLGNPWYWDPDQLAGSQAFRKQRLLDSLAFLYELQNEFYAKFTKAMRDAGYEGEFISSNWQAGRAYSHLLNLHSDALVGTVDRHNYFAGGEGIRIDNTTMLAVPGSGILSSGMQQVTNRPFMLSEWIHVTPNEWGVEGPAIIGAYGMGLQGWDVSFLFQNSDDGGFRPVLNKDRWEATAPQIMGVFPAVARQVLRGDVIQANVRAECNAHVPSLLNAQLGFQDEVTQQYDVKAFGTDKVPAAALAVARCGVTFTEEAQDTPAFDLSRYQQPDGSYLSCTKQLRWQPGGSKLDGHFTIDTPGTKAVVGFAEGLACELSDVTLTSKSRFAAIYVTAQDKDQDLATGRNLLVVALARARNSGMRVLNDNRILERGGEPILLEPVRAEILVRRAGAAKVYLLDHSGRKTDRTLPIRDGKFEIDGARDRTCYYLISYE
jgi:hypothetical protein